MHPLTPHILGDPRGQTPEAVSWHGRSRLWEIAPRKEAFPTAGPGVGACEAVSLFCLNPSVTSPTLQSPGPHGTLKALCNLPVLTFWNSWKAAVSQLLRLLWAPGVPPCLSVAHSCWALSSALRFPFLWDFSWPPKSSLEALSGWTSVLPPR